MAMFPVEAEEIERVEAAIGVSLPRKYKQLLGDPKVQAALRHKKIGMLVEGKRMDDFVALTERMRATEPGFPKDGVLAFCSVAPTGEFQLAFGYPRIWLPDPKAPTSLGETLYSWHLGKGRCTKDCSNKTWIDGVIDSLCQTAPEDAVSLGFQALEPKKAESLRVRSVSQDVLAALSRSWDPSQSGVWTFAGQLELSGKFMSIVDAGEQPTARSACINVGPGIYDVWMSFRKSKLGDRPVIGGLKVVLNGEDADGLGRTLKVDVDWAAVAVYDRQAFFRATRSEEREFFCTDMAALEERPVLVKAGRKTEVLLVPTGDGDGTYEVKELREGVRVIGFVGEF
jgi:hypothetical protein